MDVTGDGIHTVECQAQDVAGNQASASATVRIDTIEPQVFLSPEKFPYWEEFSVWATGSPYTSIRSMVVRIEGGAGRVRTWTFEGPGEHVLRWDTAWNGGAFARPGEYTVTVTATDGLGRTASVSGIVIVPASQPSSPTSTPTPTPVSAVVTPLPPTPAPTATQPVPAASVPTVTTPAVLPDEPSPAFIPPSPAPAPANGSAFDTPAAHTSRSALGVALAAAGALGVLALRDPRVSETRRLKQILSRRK